MNGCRMRANCCLRAASQSSEQASAPTRTRPLCPYPKTAVYKGGDINLEASYACEGNIETRENVCMDLVAKYQHETSNELDTKGLDHPGMCKAHHDHGHHHHHHRGHDRDDD